MQGRSIHRPPVTVNVPINRHTVKHKPAPKARRAAPPSTIADCLASSVAELTLACLQSPLPLPLRVMWLTTQSGGGVTVCVIAAHTARNKLHAYLHTPGLECISRDAWGNSREHLNAVVKRLDAQARPFEAGQPFTEQQGKRFITVDPHPTSVPVILCVPEKLDLMVIEAPEETPAQQRMMRDAMRTRYMTAADLYAFHSRLKARIVAAQKAARMAALGLPVGPI